MSAEVLFVYTSVVIVYSSVVVVVGVVCVICWEFIAWSAVVTSRRMSCHCCFQSHSSLRVPPCPENIQMMRNYEKSCEGKI